MELFVSLIFKGVGGCDVKKFYLFLHSKALHFSINMYSLFKTRGESAHSKALLSSIASIKVVLCLT